MVLYFCFASCFNTFKKKIRHLSLTVRINLLINFLNKSTYRISISLEWPNLWTSLRISAAFSTLNYTTKFFVSQFWDASGPLALHPKS